MTPNASRRLPRNLTSSPSSLHITAAWLAPVAGLAIGTPALTALGPWFPNAESPDLLIARLGAWSLCLISLYFLLNHTLALSLRGLNALGVRTERWNRWVPRASALAAGLILTAPTPSHAAPPPDTTVITQETHTQEPNATTATPSASAAFPIDGKQAVTPAKQEATQQEAAAFTVKKADPVPLPRSMGTPARADTVIVKTGDTLWDLAARHLGPGATPQQIAKETQRWHNSNRELLGDNPHLIQPGQELLIPA